MTALPDSERRALLEELDLESERVRLVATFEDGEALFAAVCERGLEGVVAKRDRDPYPPGERQWVKTKNRATARFAEERDGMGRRIAAGAQRYVNPNADRRGRIAELPASPGKPLGALELGAREVGARERYRRAASEGTVLRVS